MKIKLPLAFLLLVVLLLIGCISPTSEAFGGWAPITVAEFFNDTVWIGHFYGIDPNTPYSALKLSTIPSTGQMVFREVYGGQSMFDAFTRLTTAHEYIVTALDQAEEGNWYIFRVTSLAGLRYFKIHKSGTRAHIFNEKYPDAGLLADVDRQV
ncbi:MAG: hypothetical protein ACRCZM_04840 [Bacteroidales bacterium]